MSRRIERKSRGWRNDLQLRRGIKQLLRDLDLDAPLDVSLLCERLAHHRGRAIKLRSYPLPTPGAFGLWVGTAEVDYILYQQDTTVAHQEHIILHEIGHIISGHDSNENDQDIWQQIFPDIPPEIVLRALRRDGYGPVREREAEMAATVIKEWETLLERLQFSPDPKTDSARRVRGAFDDHQGWM